MSFNISYITKSILISKCQKYLSSIKPELILQYFKTYKMWAILRKLFQASFYLLTG